MGRVRLARILKHQQNVPAVISAAIVTTGYLFDKSYRSSAMSEGNGMYFVWFEIMADLHYENSQCHR